MFQTNIECALSDLISSNKDITVANTFPVYMRVAGFTEFCHEAVTSFEHAMDKYPQLATKSRAVSAKQMRRLIQEYWMEKLGMFAKDLGGRLCPCEVCGKEIAIAPPGVGGKYDALKEEEWPKKKRSLKLKKAKRVSDNKRVEGLATEADPYAPSTSASVL